MKIYELIAPCHFGLEAVMKREILDLGYEVSQVEDGRVTFIGDAEAVCRANIFLRTTERILLKVGSFKAETFEELFQGVKALPWENWIGKSDRFPVKGWSLNSTLHSVPDCQAIIKKAVSRAGMKLSTSSSRSIASVQSTAGASSMLFDGRKPSSLRSVAMPSSSFSETKWATPLLAAWTDAPPSCS